MKITFVNLTSKTVRVLDDENVLVAAFEPQGTYPLEEPMAATVSEVGLVAADVPGAVKPIRIPIDAVTFTGMEDLPEPEEGTLFIVSPMVQARHPEREDLVIPCALVPDEMNGCRSFSFLGEVPASVKLATRWGAVPAAPAKAASTVRRVVSAVREPAPVASLLNLTGDEARFLTDALKETEFDEAKGLSAASHLLYDVENAIEWDHLADKWGIDGELFLERLHVFQDNEAQAAALFDSVAAYWKAAPHTDVDTALRQFGILLPL